VSRVIDEHRARFGVEPICRTLDVSVSAYYQRRTGQRSPRRIEDERLTDQIRRLHRANFESNVRLFRGCSWAKAIAPPRWP
jgi:putative transposase